MSSVFGLGHCAENSVVEYQPNSPAEVVLEIPELALAILEFLDFRDHSALRVNRFLYTVLEESESAAKAWAYVKCHFPSSNPCRSLSPWKCFCQLERAAENVRKKIFTLRTFTIPESPTSLHPMKDELLLFKRANHFSPSVENTWGKLHLWNWQTGEKIRSIPCANQAMKCVIKNGVRCIGTRENELIISDIAGKKEIARLTDSGYYGGGSFGLIEGYPLLVIPHSYQSTCQVWDYKAQQYVATSPGSIGTRLCTTSAEGSLYITTDFLYEKKVYKWDVKTDQWEPLKKLQSTQTLPTPYSCVLHQGHFFFGSQNCAYLCPRENFETVSSHWEGGNSIGKVLNPLPFGNFIFWQIVQDAIEKCTHIGITDIRTAQSSILFETDEETMITALGLQDDHLFVATDRVTFQRGDLGSSEIHEAKAHVLDFGFPIVETQAAVQEQDWKSLRGIYEQLSSERKNFLAAAAAGKAKFETLIEGAEQNQESALQMLQAIALGLPGKSGIELNPYTQVDSKVGPTANF